MRYFLFETWKRATPRLIWECVRFIFAPHSTFSLGLLQSHLLAYIYIKDCTKVVDIKYKSCNSMGSPKCLCLYSNALTLDSGIDVAPGITVLKIFTSRFLYFFTSIYALRSFKKNCSKIFKNE